MKFGKLDARILGAILALAFVLLIIMSVVLKQGADWWSAWGQWVGGIGSIGAAAVAVWIAVEGWRKSEQHAEQQAQELKELQARELASKFGVWVEQIALPIAGPPARAVKVELAYTRPRGFAGETYAYALRYINSGPQPVYRVRVGIVIPNENYETTVPFLGPSSGPMYLETKQDTFNKYFLDRMQNIVDDVNSSPDIGEELEVDVLREAFFKFLALTVDFTDGNGMRWRRNSFGDLTPLGPDEDNSGLRDIITEPERILRNAAVHKQYGTRN
ncbi:hypothetical protein BS329_35875 [Amycolatopsis coloradensis]|uniref:Uncharacterized protein n=1 Tax=Amycolatopsis coloradensis TaxID=76021 RepID=A0A1R0KGH8_9PSEU|nr:hypothetical protein [Amycolatopsis coloradensis]OLZ44686.1 hypothetical protein BS329_35875 [Amycolatopsis coloradensis]